MSSINTTEPKPYYTQPIAFQPVVNEPFKSALVFGNRWSSGICGCCEDCFSCCCATWCFPCFGCCYLDPAARECACTSFFLSGTGISLIGIPYSACPGFAIMRAKVRAAYKIDGSIVEDCLCSACCACCTALQIYRELKLHGETN